MTTAPSKRI
jgi:hypothetical protein